MQGRASSSVLARRELQQAREGLCTILPLMQRRSRPDSSDEEEPVQSRLMDRVVQAAEEVARNPEIQRIVGENRQFRELLTEMEQLTVARLTGPTRPRLGFGSAAEFNDDQNDDDRREENNTPGILLAAAVGAAAIIPLSDTDEQTSDDKPSFSEVETTVSESDDASLPGLSDDESEEEKVEVSVMTRLLLKLATVPPFSWVVAAVGNVRDYTAVPGDAGCGGEAARMPAFRPPDIAESVDTDAPGDGMRVHMQQMILSMAFLIIAMALLKRKMAANLA